MTILPADEPTTYELQARDGRLTILTGNGEPVSWACYTLTSHNNLARWQTMYEPFFAAGVHHYQLQIWPAALGGAYWENAFWSMDGNPVTEPPRAVNLTEQAQFLIAADPLARFTIRIRIHPDVNWRNDHTSEFQPMDDLHPNERRGPEAWSIMSSLASDICLERTKAMVRDHIAWCERQDWANRIVGYAILPLGEGGTDVANRGGLFDRSGAMNRAWRDWVAHHYPDDAALRAAWNEPEVSRATVQVPTEAEWFARKERLGVMHWPEPAQVRRETDYFALQKALFHRWWREIFDIAEAATALRPCLVSVDNFKQPQHGWLHNPGFFGAWTGDTLDQHGNWMITTGCVGVAPLLDHPGLDMVWTPGMYYNRAMGFAWETEGLTDSLVQRGKLNYTEGDFRSWVDRNIDGTPRIASQIADAGVALTPEEAQAAFRRALAWALSRNQMFWFCSVYGGHWWYHDPTLTPLLAESRSVIDRSMALPWRPLRDAICLVVDDESGMYEDFSGGFQHLAVNRQIEEGLALCGVPYRIHLLSDLERDDFPGYRTYLLPNLFKVDDHVLELLQRKVLRDGAVAVFGPGTGITDGVTRSAEPASRLFGVPMELHAKRSTRRLILAGTLARQLPVQIITDSYSYGPVLTPATQRLPGESGARPLGSAFYYHNLDRPGAFVREVGRGAAGNGQAGDSAAGEGGVVERGAGDYAMIFVPAVPLSPEFLRECARFAGSHIYSEQNAVVYASPGFVSLHVPAAGRWPLALPSPVRVSDFATGEVLAERASRVEIVTGGPETRLLRLESLTEPE